MIIAKPAAEQLLIDDILENYYIDPKNHKINISYSADDGHPIGYVACENYEYFVDFLNYLNVNNFAALIWVADRYIKLYDEPFHFDENLCFAYEGFFNKQPGQVEKLFQDIKKDVDNPHKNASILWMLDKIVSYKDCLVFMDNAGKFTFIGQLSKYLYKNIYYIIYGTFNYKPKTATTLALADKKEEVLTDEEVLTRHYAEEWYGYCG